MSPSRAPARGYRPARPKREVLLAALGVAVVVLVAAGLIWLLAPGDETEPEPVFTPPPVEPTPSTALPSPTTTSATTPG